MLEIVGAAIGILTFTGGILAWYRGVVERNVAHRRDWEHIKNNQRELVKNLDFLFKEFDKRFDHLDNQILELKGMFYSSIKRNQDE